MLSHSLIVRALALAFENSIVRGIFSDDVDRCSGLRAGETGYCLRAANLLFLPPNFSRPQTFATHRYRIETQAESRPLRI